MKTVLLTEDKLNSIISEAVEQVLDGAQNEQILMGIADAITNLGNIPCHVGENELYGQIHIGEYDVDIDYVVESDAYYEPKDEGDIYNIEPSRNFVDGETRVFVVEIYVNSENGDNLIDIEDNGIVANALKSVIEIDNMSYPERDIDNEYYDDDEY